MTLHRSWLGEPAGAPMRKGGVYFAQWQWIAAAGRWLLQSEVYVPVASDYLDDPQASSTGLSHIA